MTALSARVAYPLWASHYHAETAVSHLENIVVASLGVRTSGLALLDVGCGTARRLHDADAAMAIGVDLTPEMLARASGAHLLAAADLRSLPFAAAAFDVVWCRLVIGHVRDVDAAYAEMTREDNRRIPCVPQCAPRSRRLPQDLSRQGPSCG